MDQSKSCKTFLYCLSIALLLSLPTAQAQTTLYQQLGASAGVQAITADLIKAARTDPKTSRSFAKINEPRLIKLLAQQICLLSDGGCVYEGENMKVTHAGMGITEAEFAGLVEHLREVLDQRGISTGAKNELLKRLAPMKRDIVETTKPEAATTQ